MTLNSKHKGKKLTVKLKTKNQKDTEIQNTKTKKGKNLVLPKEWVENVDLYIPVLKKIMTTRK